MGLGFFHTKNRRSKKVLLRLIVVPLLIKSILLAMFLVCIYFNFVLLDAIQYLFYV